MLALVAHRFGFTWAEMQTFKVWQLAVLVDFMNTEQRRQKAAQQQANRRTR